MMIRKLIFCFIGLAGCWWTVYPVLGQDVAPPGPAAGSGADSPSGPFRRLAPGVLRQVFPPLEYRETYSRHDLVELLAANPNLDYAKQVWFRRTVWYLDFQFKDVRFAFVDLPRPDGNLERTLVWYMVFTVTNPGGAIRAVEQPDGTFTFEKTDVPILYVPEFYLEAPEVGRLYPERLIPAAVAQIRRREDPNRRFLNTAEIATEIQVGQTLWGIVTWTDIAPTVDFFSVYVGGLTNAYEWEDPPGAYQIGNPPLTGRKFQRKYLKINFWRPGDEYYEHEKEIRYGQPGRPDYEWVYRPVPFLASSQAAKN
jgi:hypothetical protein